MVLPFSPIDLILHFDKYLPLIIQEYGLWTYAVLFIILFCETGLVVTPYLPGDSLLFVAGTLAGVGVLDIWLLMASLIIAAILGDTVNYWIGYTFELKVLEWKFSLVKKEHLAETHEYFEKYGGLTIVIARFIPFIRTFAPFLAGVGKMRYSWFLGYNIVGGAAWVSAFLLAGYFFGNLAIVQQNFSLVVYIIIGLSFLAFGSIFIRIIRSMRSG
jgi:membrane-associated protein